MGDRAERADEAHDADRLPRRPYPDRPRAAPRPQRGDEHRGQGARLCRRRHGGAGRRALRGSRRDRAPRRQGVHVPRGAGRGRGQCLQGDRPADRRRLCALRRQRAEFARLAPARRGRLCQRRRRCPEPPRRARYRAPASSSPRCGPDDHAALRGRGARRPVVGVAALRRREPGPRGEADEAGRRLRGARRRGASRRPRPVRHGADAGRRRRLAPRLERPQPSRLEEPHREKPRLGVAGALRHDRDGARSRHRRHGRDGARRPFRRTLAPGARRDGAAAGLRGMPARRPRRRAAPTGVSRPPICRLA